jgi:hypothetical protein
LHLALMALAWFSLPVSLAAEAVPNGGLTAGLWLIGLMAKSIGYPFFFLSATAPLLQSWFARTTHRDAGNPYFLYSASNIGSLGALIAYPFIVEPLVGLHLQAQLWSIGFFILLAAIAMCGLAMLRNQTTLVANAAAAISAPTTWAQRGWWILMSFVPSALLVAWTNHITTDIASAPFLWLPPLVLFLLTFVLVFRDKTLVSMKVARVAQLLSLPLAFGISFALPLFLALPVMLVGAISFFSTAIICHRQLYESRPDAQHLTEFYMLMSLGGVLGGLFVSLAAPLLFNSVLEYPLLLIIGIIVQKDLLHDEKVLQVLRKPLIPILIFVGVLAAATYAAHATSQNYDITKRSVELAFFVAAAFIMMKARRVGLNILATIMAFITYQTSVPQERVVLRSYFGVLTVADKTAEGPFRQFLHGTTMHGAQRLDELTPGFAGRPHPVAYFAPQGGMPRSVLATQDMIASEGRSGGIFRIIGLGSGSLACYSKPNEDWAYYEIDPDVIKVATDPAQFTYMSACQPNAKITEGDARITIQNEAAVKADYLLVDAFSSDSIPVHLITTEAIQLYLTRLKDNGVLTIHVTNRYMDLVPIVAANMAAVDPAFQGRVIDFVPPTNTDLNAMHTIVIMLSKNPKALEMLDKTGGTKPLVLTAGVEKWTDDFANLPAAMLRRMAVTKY